MRFYDEYKPFRNYMQRFALLEGLVDVWQYSLHVMEGQPLPPGYAAGKERLTPRPVAELVYPWHLDILARELVLNARHTGERSLKRWNDLAIAGNHIRRLDDAAFTSGSGRGQPDVLLELHRMAHRQFPWQSDVGFAPIVRAFKVFGNAAVDALAVRELGMTMRQFLLLGAAVAGHFLREWGMTDRQDYSQALGIGADASAAFFDRVSCTIAHLKAETQKRQSYGQDWQYTWNPLEATPLVRFDPANPDRLVCPIQRYLLRRVSTGVFFDLIKSAGFDQSYGSAFQAYVGEVIGKTMPGSRVTLTAERTYLVGDRLHHGVDWIVSDPSAHLFVECKAKRLTVDSKTAHDTVALERDLLVMAKAIVQHYGNIRRALEGRTHWIPDHRPVYPVVLTLEDWHVFTPRVMEILKARVGQLSAEAGIPATMLEEMPWTVASSFEFEAASQVMASVGIGKVMAAKTATDHRDWSLLPFVTSIFREEIANVNWRLFPEAWASLIPVRPGARGA